MMPEDEHASASKEIPPAPRRSTVEYPLGLAAASLVCALIGAFALWYTSSGRFPAFPKIQNDYIDLGQAFLGGQLSLQEQPDPRLAELPNPYEYKQRKNLPYHWDASYFDGKYYLYWGPVPALVAAGIQGLSGARVPAAVLVDLAYLCLLPIFLALLVQLSRPFSGSAAGGTLWLFVLIGFANLPLLFLIGQPRHYQASILYGQLFLTLGLLGFARYAAGAGRPSWLALCGLSWGLAFACRYNLAISVGIYILFAAFWIIRRAPQDGILLPGSLLVAPLALCLLGLGLYNAARFGNPLETGLTYQLTIPEFREISYSVSYVPSNLYVYLAYPLTGSNAFPFIQSAHFRLALVPPWLNIPTGREFDQVMFGVMGSVPALWILFVATAFLLLTAKGLRGGVTTPNPGNPVLAMAGAAAAGQFLFLLVFFYAAERYVADFYLPLILCIALAVWRMDEALAGRRVLRAVLWLTVSALAVWTAAIGYFGCFGVPTLVGNFYQARTLADLASFWNGLHAHLLGLWHPLAG